MKFTVTMTELGCHVEEYQFHYTVVQNDFPRKSWEGYGYTREDTLERIEKTALWIKNRKPFVGNSWEFEV